MQSLRDWLPFSLQNVQTPGRASGPEFRRQPGFDQRVGKPPDQLAQDVGVQQIHPLVEPGCRRAGRGMTLGFNSLQNLEDGRVIRNTHGIEVGAIRQTSQLPPTGRRSACPMSGKSGTNRLLFLLREALDQFDDVQRRRTHGQNSHSNPPSNKGFLPPQPNVGLGKSQ